MANFKHFIDIKQFIKRNRFLSYGLPFVLLMVCGSFGLEKFAQLRYTFRQTKMLKSEQAEMLGLETGAKRRTLESEYENIKDLDIEHWENVRGPRPWEQSLADASSTTSV